jgi:hypothetical protein
MLAVTTAGTAITTPIMVWPIATAAITTAIMAPTAAAPIMGVIGDGSLVDARTGSTAMDTNTRLAILVLISLFGLVWTRVLSRRRPLPATRLYDHEARPRVGDFRRVVPVVLRRRK